MSGGEQVWICRVCRSINSLGRDRCYKCHTPIEVAATSAADLPMAPSGEEILRPTGTFRTTETRAVLVSLAAVVFILATFVALWVLGQANELQASGDLGASNAIRHDRLFPLIVVVAIAGILTLVSYAFWIRRVVENLPALGLGYAKVSPSWAFVEPLIPGLNVPAIPARMADVVNRLGGHTGSLALIGAAGILAVAPGAVSLIALRFTRFFGTGDEFLRVSAGVLTLVFAFQAAAIVLLLVVVWQIESLQRAKREAM